MKAESKLEKGEKTSGANRPLISIVDDDEALRTSRKASGRQRLWFLGHFVPGQKRSALSGHQGPIAAKFSIAAKQQLW